ncbi:MAG: hypothetical protein KGZ94_04770 [Clostridia bacterium]|nr:hypothetical protein [Clostridia bacterium]
MTIRIGIPQSLFYYYYYPLWSTYFKETGCHVVVSNNTNKNIATRGVQLTVDEACFPVKIYFGHTENLLSRVDYIFCPRIVSIEPKEYICPKFMGLPDMVKAAFNHKVKWLTPTIALKKNCQQEHKTAFIAMARELKIDSKLAHHAWDKAVKAQLNYEKFLLKELTPNDALEVFSGSKTEKKLSNRDAPSIAVLGHGYNLYDPHLNMNLIKKLRDHGFNILTPEMVDKEIINQQSSKLRKRIFWTLGKKIIGSLYDFSENNRIQGIIYVASFGCGPDSLIGHLAEGYIRKNNIPFMLLTLDEHTGEAGVNTRLEAFLDMLRRREAV